MLLTKYEKVVPYDIVPENYKVAVRVPVLDLEQLTEDTRVPAEQVTPLGNVISEGNVN